MAKEEWDNLQSIVKRIVWKSNFKFNAKIAKPDSHWYPCRDVKKDGVMALEKVSLDGNECEELMKDGIAFKNNWDRMNEFFFGIE